MQCIPMAVKELGNVIGRLAAVVAEGVGLVLGKLVEWTWVVVIVVCAAMAEAPGGSGAS